MVARVFVDENVFLTEKERKENEFNDICGRRKLNLSKSKVMVF